MLKEEKISKKIEKIFREKKYERGIRTEKLIALNPLEILKRGYTVTKKNQNIIKISLELEVGDKIETILKDGKIISKIEEII